MNRDSGIPRWAGAPLLAAISVTFFAPGIFFGNVPVFRDLLLLVIPLRTAARAAIRSGHLPLWTPDIFFGAPLLANYQSATLYPPSLILYALPFAEGFSLFLAFHLFIAGWGMSRYLRLGNQLGAGESMFGGVVFAFGGFFVSLVPWTNQLEVAAWLPWALEAGERLRRGDRAHGFRQLALVLTFQALGGAPEAFLQTVILVFVDCLRRGFPRPDWKAAEGLLGALLIASGAAAIQLFPTADYALQTDRADILSFASVAVESLQWRSLWQFVLPHTFIDGSPAFIPEGRIPFVWSLYIGVPALVFAVAAIIRRPLDFWVGVLAVSALLALGSSTPVLALLYSLIPRVVGAFRFPEKFFLLGHAALAVLAAEGFACFLSRSDARSRTAWILAGLVTFGIAANFCGMLFPEPFLHTLGFELPAGISAGAVQIIARPLSRLALRLVIVCVAVGFVLWISSRLQSQKGIVVGLVTLIAIGDLLPIHQPSLVFTEWKSLWHSGEIESGRFAPGERLFHYCTKSPGCVVAGAPGIGPWNGMARPGEDAEAVARQLWASLVPNIAMVYERGATTGNDGFSTRDQRAFYRALSLSSRADAVHLLAALGVSALIGPEPLTVSALRLLTHSETADFARWVYAVEDRAPRVYWAERTRTAADVGAALEMVASTEFRPGRDAVLTGAGPTAEEELTPGVTEEIRFESTHVDARVSLDAPGLLVIGDTFLPGWQATIDGNPTEILRVNGVVRGLRVPPGRHRVLVRYDPASFRWGCAVSLLTGLVVGSMFMRNSLRS